jgi:hypothetical protein
MKKDKAYELHHLIQSLIASEKKYIRRQLIKYEGETTKDLLLFDLLNHEREPETEALKKAYENKGYQSDYLSADKNKLYEEILSGLSELNADYSNEIKANESLQKAIVLYEKKLFEQCLKQLTKAKKMAETYELWGLMISLLHLEQRCHRVRFDFEKAKEAMGAESAVFERQQLLNTFAEIHYESISLRVKYSKARSNEQLTAFDNLVQRLESIGKGNDFYTEFNRLETLCNYFYVKDDLEQDMRSNSSLNELMQAHKWYIEDNPLNYIAVRTRLLGIQRRLSPQLFWKELPNYRSLPKQVQKQKQAAEINVFIFSNNFELDQLLLENRWQEAFELIEPMEKGIEKYREQIDGNWLYSAVYRFACTSLFSANYNKSLDYIHKALNDFPESLRPDLYNAALMLQIIVHYEICNYKLIPSLVSNARYNFKKSNRLYRTETLMLNTLKRLSDFKKEPVATEKLFKELRVKLLKFRNDDFEKKAFSVFDFLEWLDFRSNV